MDEKELIELGLMEDPADPEGLRKPYYDGNKPIYDYEQRPLKITTIQYALDLTQMQVEILKQEMEATKTLTLYVVPFYNKNGEMDEDFCEIFVTKEGCTRHILDDDSQYGAARWQFDGEVFRIGTYRSDIVQLLKKLHKKLGTTIPENMLL